MLGKILDLARKTFFGNVDDRSTPGKVDTIDIAKLLRDGAIMAGTCFLTFMIDNVGLVESGEWTPIVMVVTTSVSQFIRKFLSDNK